MHDGFVRVAVRAPRVTVADVAANVAACAEAIAEAGEAKAKVVVLPELAITGATCGDLFWQASLVAVTEVGVAELAAATANVDALVLVGAPVAVSGRLYNCAIAIAHGAVLGIVPATNVGTGAGTDIASNRHFAAAPAGPVISMAFADGRNVPFGANQLFSCPAVDGLTVAAELGADLDAPVNPGTNHAATGATLVAGLAASYELASSAARRRTLALAHSSRLNCAYAIANAVGESTTDGVCAGHCLVAEGGSLLAEAAPFGTGAAIAEIDVATLTAARSRTGTFAHVTPGIACGHGHGPVFAPKPESHNPAPSFGAKPHFDAGQATATRASGPNPLGHHVTTARASAPGPLGHHFTFFDLAVETTELTRTVNASPFLPSGSDDECAATYETILSAQATGLARRLNHTKSARVVIGVSGGLDSTLALLVCARAFVAGGRSNADIIAVTMPGFGTTARTRGNAEALVWALGATLRRVPIANAVSGHFADIGHDPAVRNAAYENAQARERTQILMDMANDEAALVVGTGDMSELALGWATYNGDHMSMYGVNAGVPKTLVRRLVAHVATTTLSGELSRVLEDVLSTPVSPELLPANDDGSIAQQTEDLVGPYELHDFYLYHVLRHGCPPRKLLRLARAAWGHAYDDATLLKWLRTFYQRFFSQQFKRSCMPDGPAVLDVSLSPRGGLVMPSDAAATLWLRELEEL